MCLHYQQTRISHHLASAQRALGRGKEDEGGENLILRCADQNRCPIGGASPLQGRPGQPLGPESCRGYRKGLVEAWTGEPCSVVWSRERRYHGGPTWFMTWKATPTLALWRVTLDVNNPGQAPYRGYASFPAITHADYSGMFWSPSLKEDLILVLIQR